MEIATYPLQYSNSSIALNIPTYFLPSIDLEDIRKQVPNCENYKNRVPLLVAKCLEFFNKYNCKCTFFVVGETALDNSSSTRDIIAEGHELACHTQDHRPLNQLTPMEFRDNILKNRDILLNLGAQSVVGFRSPIFSLTNETQWAWEVLDSLGFKYSSSVLPAKNPQYGWDGFHFGVTRLSSGLWELPIPITHIANIQLPFTGGAYLRFFPKPILYFFSQWYKNRKLPLLSYIHPYDLDPEQERFQVFKNRFFNWLMYYNRASTLPKIALFLKMFPTTRYIDYINLLEVNYSALKGLSF